MIHDVDPSVLGGEYKQGHQSLDNSRQGAEMFAYSIRNSTKVHTFLSQTTHTCANNTRSTNLSQVIKVVLVVDPLVVGLQTVRLVGNVFDIRAEAVEKLAFKQLPGEEQ